jgi:hypothetical protein
VDVPLPRSRLGPAGPAGGALFRGVSKWPESAESIHVCGVDGPSPRIDLAPPQPLRMRGHFLWNPWISARRRPQWPSPPRANSCNPIFDNRPGHDEIAAIIVCSSQFCE